MAKNHVRIRKITLIGVLCALCIVLRIIKLPVPNVQPVTDILMIVTLTMGVRYGFLLATLTMVLSNIILGFGIWTLPQIAAYMVCILTIAAFKWLLPLEHWFWLQLLLCTLLGFEYGLVVSLGMAVIGSAPAFLAYYLSGLLFDLAHAIGNFVFYPLLKPPLTKALKRYMLT
ncbi:ECF transporter S component [Agrilactobacillus yilanensis]|uniref:ECF transporter S component n=1 Tax=Agrilactobacillus yilanensis TaxID=2485997 RepID=A0ABW4JAF4_9LACO|nr:ECF transporter S component [Agrilactobacillus yilanensis]